MFSYNGYKVDTSQIGYNLTCFRIINTYGYEQRNKDKPKNRNIKAAK